MNYESVPDDSMIFDFNNNGKKGLYQSFDPSGGPYICLGYDDSLMVLPLDES